MGRDGAASATLAARGGVRSWRCTSTAASLSGGCRALSSRSCAATCPAGSPCPAAVRRSSACRGGRSPDAGRARGRGGGEAEACGRASARLEVLGAFAAIAQLGGSGPQAGGVRALAPIAQQVGDRLAARLLAQVAGVVLAPLLPAAERGVGPVRLRVEEEEPAAVEDQSTRLPPHPHGAQGAPCARLVSSDQGSTRRLTQRSATTKAAAVRIAIHASSAARPGVTVPRVSARHTFTACVSGRSQAKDRKSTRLNSSHRCISYAVFCLKKKN